MDRDDLVRDVYAHFGLAIYKANVLEHGLTNAMLYANMAAGGLPRVTDFDEFLTARFEKTLGQLIKDLKNHVPVDATLEEILKTALTTRNWIAHHYFRERSETFMSDRGCRSMIAELESAQDLFERAEKALDAVSKPFAEKIGLTEDRLEAYVAQVKLKAEADG